MKDWLSHQAGSVVLVLWVLLSGGCTKMKIGGVSVEAAFPDSRVAALANAACEGRIEQVKALVAGGVGVDSPGASDGRPLLWAMECHNRAGVKALLQLGADPNYSYGNHGSAIWIAAAEPDSEMLKLLMAHGGDINRRYQDDSPLMRSLVLGVDKGYWENYYLLLNAGADIDQTGELHRTIAEYAVTLGQFDKISELLQRGYSHDLGYLLTLVENVNVDENHQPARRQLIDQLRRRIASESLIKK